MKRACWDPKRLPHSYHRRLVQEELEGQKCEAMGVEDMQVVEEGHVEVEDERIEGVEQDETKKDGLEMVDLWVAERVE